MRKDQRFKIFSGSGGESFAKRICEYVNVNLSKSEVIKFSEGNIYVKANETVRNEDVYLVQSIDLNPNDQLVEIMFWIDAFKRSSARSVTLIMPFFSYAKGDKTDEPRTSIRARVCAEVIELAGVDRVITLDLHAPQIEGFFKKPVDHLVALPLLCEYIKKLKIDDLVVVSPDAGFAKRARKYAKYLNVPLAIADKERVDHSENAKIIEIVGEVENKNVLIVDDFSISGGTIIDLAYELKKKNVNNIYACLSHCLMNKEAIVKLEKSPIDCLITTNSVNNKEVFNSNKIKVLSSSELFGEAILRIERNEGVSPLFKELPNQVRNNIIS